MAQRSIYRSTVAFYKETTPCLAPADAAAWAANGTSVEHLSANTDDVKQTFLDDMTMERRSLSTGTRVKRKGIRNNGAKVSLKLHGTGTTTADTVTVTETYLGTLLEHCMGGLYLGTSTTVTGGTATIPVLDDVADLIPGCFIAFQDTTSPTAKNTGKLHPRRVLSIDVGTKAVTLSEALPFTPAATDKAHGVELNYVGEAWLEDAVAAGGTMSWWFQKAQTGTDLLWQVEGAVASPKFGGLGRGELPQLDLDIMAANFKHGADDDLAWVDFPAPEGHAQLSCGRDILCSIATYGNTAANYLDIASVEFDPGYTRVRNETTTENIDRFEGTASYTYKPGKVRFTVSINQYANTWYANLADDTYFRITFYQPGDGSGAGKMFALHIAKAQLVETPQRTDLNENHAVKLVFEAMEPSDATEASNEDLEKSLFTVIRA